MDFKEGMKKIEIIEEIIEEIENNNISQVDVFGYLLSVKYDLVSEMMEE